MEKPKQPQPKPVNPDALPEKLRTYYNFCVWRYEWDDDRLHWTKIPYNPKTGRRAKSTDPADFTTFDEAYSASKDYSGVGVGIFSNLGAIDIDHCVSDDGTLSEMASDIMETMHTYTETSPSGKGIRILFAVPPGTEYDKDRYYIKNTNLGLEVYLSGMTNRYVTITGDSRHPGADVAFRGDELLAVVEKYMKRPEKSKKDSHSASVDLSDSDLIEKALASNDRKFRRLWSGDTTGYESQSEADLALCTRLAFWTCKDKARIDRLFRQSGLYRDKWERDDYRNATIDDGVDFCDEVYSPETFSATAPEETSSTKSGEEPPTFKAYRVSDYLKRGIYEDDIQYFKDYQFRKTGFFNIDKYITLYPGLAVIGGVASLGKSTFCVCLADNLTARGETVLYFALEQEPIELVTKSLARRVGEAEPLSPINNIDIKNGETSPTLEKVKEEYAESAERFIIVRCDFTTTAAEIRDYIEAFISETGVRPIIIIDYLQLVAPPEDFRGDTRGAIDHNIKLFKTMQTRNELFVLMVSSFNRSGYDTPVTYSDFKESSMIEFTADYIWALQLHLVSEERFYYSIGARGGRISTTEQEKSDMVHAALDADPRQIQFVCLKNRNGKQNFRCNFFYYPWFDLFVSDEKNPFDDK